MTSKELKLDHFKFYDVANQRVGVRVKLQGQFDKEPEGVELTYLNLFANPVSKNGEPLYNKYAHLNWYDIFDPAPDPIRNVVVGNQFAKKQEIYTGRACALLVPTWKVEKGSKLPKGLDHYKVYQVLRARDDEPKVKLKDQFGSDNPEVYAPAFFAVPVTKWAGGKTYKIQNAKTHLLIYKIEPRRNERTIKTYDQFGRRYVHVRYSVLLGVPSLKLKWKEI